mmetsp:Transcript_54857/g.146463  ORF Transcript_54857/g.146463 Transcript_54857/m.146463 type:complete len:228 (+) Transcript_54857:1865-2548(+)
MLEGRSGGTDVETGVCGNDTGTDGEDGEDGAETGETRDATQWCSSACDTVTRLETSRHSTRCKKFQHEVDKCGGRCSSRMGHTSAMHRNRRARRSLVAFHGSTADKPVGPSLSALNTKGRPTSACMIEQPAPQTSTAVVCSRWSSSSISGGMICHVPARDLGFSASLAHHPKSAILILPSGHKSRFSSLMSRWMNPRLWMSARPLKSWTVQDAVVVSGAIPPISAMW